MLFELFSDLFHERIAYLEAWEHLHKLLELFGLDVEIVQKVASTVHRKNDHRMNRASQKFFAVVARQLVEFFMQ